MKNKRLYVAAIFVSVALVFASTALGQKTKPAKPSKRIIFAVLDNGESAEPIAYVENKKLVAPANGSDSTSIVTAFDKTFYKPGTIYRLIFGGADAGTVRIRSSDPNAECSKNIGTAETKSTKTVLKGFVMALATNGEIRNKVGFRRKPTAAEKIAIEALVRDEYKKQKLAAATLHYQNLTAIDVNGDGKPELVGSYWIEIDKQTRGLLFFIADPTANGKYSMGYSEYKAVDQSQVMSGDMKDVDSGVYHELLLDSYDYDGDGVAEIFTYVQSFEGAGFNVYKLAGGKWTRTFEGSNYHCGY